MSSITQDLIRTVRPFGWFTEFSNYMMTTWPGRYPVSFIPAAQLFWSHPNLLYKHYIVGNGTDVGGNVVPYTWRRQKYLAYQVGWSKQQMFDIVKDVERHITKIPSICQHIIIYDKHHDEKTNTTTLRADVSFMENPFDCIITIKNGYVIMELRDKYDNEVIVEWCVFHGDEDWREAEYLKHQQVFERSDLVDRAAHELERNQIANWLDTEVRHLFERQKHWENIRAPMKEIPDPDKEPEKFIIYLKDYLLNEKKALTKAQKSFLRPPGDPTLLTMPTRVSCTVGVYSQPGVDVPMFEPRVIDEMGWVSWRWWRAIFQCAREEYGDPETIPVYPELIAPTTIGMNLFQPVIPFDMKLHPREQLLQRRGGFEFQGDLVILPDGGKEWMDTPPPDVKQLKKKLW
eukprot:TRINITY_DN17684_c0_g1_i1.p2 TRINITY_DN17684_c0_g1~~TRINITY_DN17684_c0_g1_i1.p2  ORF type:complete len:402 (+),score=45.95 TRINITY_DN17684_c0_g1_i1:65-1270(+)